LVAFFFTLKKSNPTIPGSSSVGVFRRFLGNLYLLLNCLMGFTFPAPNSRLVLLLFSLFSFFLQSLLLGAVQGDKIDISKQVVDSLEDVIRLDKKLIYPIRILRNNELIGAHSESVLGQIHLRLKQCGKNCSTRFNNIPTSLNRTQNENACIFNFDRELMLWLSWASKYKRYGFFSAGQFYKVRWFEIIDFFLLWQLKNNSDIDGWILSLFCLQLGEAMLSTRIGGTFLSQESETWPS